MIRYRRFSLLDTIAIRLYNELYERIITMQIKGQKGETVTWEIF